MEWAFEEARSLGHDYVCTEHLILGLLRENGCVAAMVLDECGVTLNRVRKEVASLNAPSPLIVTDGV